MIQKFKPLHRLGMMSLCLSVLGLGACSVSSQEETKPGPAAIDERGVDAATKTAENLRWPRTIDESQVASRAGDQQLLADLAALWQTDDPKAYGGLRPMALEGHVMVIGHIDSKAHRERAVQLAQITNGVLKVYDHMVIKSEKTEANEVPDQSLAIVMRRALFFDGEVLNFNYNIDALDGTLYIQGIARSSEEQDRVLAHARNVAGIKKLIAYIRLKNSKAAPQVIAKSLSGS